MNSRPLTYPTFRPCVEGLDFVSPIRSRGHAGPALIEPPSGGLLEVRARSILAESGTRSRFLIWSHFLRKTGLHFSGKCSNDPAGDGFDWDHHWIASARGRLSLAAGQ